MALSPERRAARRRTIIDAAHALIRESGDAGFSMVELARRAGVSQATPYNLLGSKGDVLRAVVRDEYESFAARLDALPAMPALDRLLAATALVVTHYEAEPGFYRGLYRAMLGQNAPELRGMMALEGQHLWHGMVEAAMDSGALGQTVSAPALTTLLLRMMTATIDAWLAEDWPAPCFSKEMDRAVRVLLLGLASLPYRQCWIAELSEISPEKETALRA